MSTIIELEAQNRNLRLSCFVYRAHIARMLADKKEYAEKVKSLVEAATMAQSWMNSRTPCEDQDCDMCSARARLNSAMEDIKE